MSPAKPAHPVVVFVLGLLALVLPIAFAFMLGEWVLPPGWRDAGSSVVAAALVLWAYRQLVRRLEKREASEVAVRSAPAELARGLLLGVAAVAACLLAVALVGGLHLGARGAWVSVPKSATLMVLVAVSEETLSRGLIHRLVERSWGSARALAVSVGFFTVAHLPGAHVTVLALGVTAAAGAAFSLAFMMSRRLWLSIGLHFAWNFALDGVLAIPVSGHESKGWLSMTLDGPTWLTGGAYGLEGSVTALVVWLLMGALMGRVAAKRGGWAPAPKRARGVDSGRSIASFTRASATVVHGALGPVRR